MFVIYIVVEGIEYRYGADSNRNKANAIAMEVREQCGIEDAYVIEE